MMPIPPDAKHAIDELRLIGGEELVREMAETFDRFAATQLERLTDATDAGDLDLAATLAHTLHASARQLGAIPLAEAALSLEVASRGLDANAAVLAAERARQAFADAQGWMRSLRA